jgi:nucleotide-binding universal stress UspA family protein
MKIRRIVTAFGVGPDSGSILAAVAALAALHDAELEALFVEGDDLSRFAALPFARELGFPSAAPRRLDPEAVARSLQARAREARIRLAAATGRTDPRWSFRAARGSLVEALRAASPQADLVVVGNRPWDPAALQLVRAGVATLLVLPPGAKLAGPLYGVCATTTAPAQAVTTLCALADAIGDGLTVVVAGPGDDEAVSWQDAAAAALKRQGRDATVRRLPAKGALDLSRVLQGGTGVAAFLGAEDALGESAANALLRASRVPVFICRG